MPIPESLKPFLRESFHKLGSILAPQLFQHWKGVGTILGYHRVLPDKEYAKSTGPYRNLSISVSRFREQMKFIKENYDIVDMNRMSNHIMENDSGFRVAVTFDDGYRDNLLHALPVLEEFDIPATIYIVTRFPEGDTRMWWFDLWDEIQKRELMIIYLRGRIQELPCSSLREQKQTYKTLSELLISSSPTQTWSRIMEWKNNQPLQGYPELLLSWSEIKHLNLSPLITIGAHTHTHPNLSLCTETELFEEMYTCKQILESKLGDTIKHFAYPYGGADQVAEREFTVAMEVGFSTAVTTRSSPIKQTQPHALPRQFPKQETCLSHMQNRLNGWNSMFRTQA